MSRVDVKPESLRWAVGRSRRSIEGPQERFPKLPGWLRRESSPTLRQLEEFAAATHTPIGFLFLGEPPVERLPIPDFRSMDPGRMREPSANLLDTT